MCKELIHAEGHSCFCKCRSLYTLLDISLYLLTPHGFWSFLQSVCGFSAPLCLFMVIDLCVHLLSAFSKTIGGMPVPHLFLVLFLWAILSFRRCWLLCWFEKLPCPTWLQVIVSHSCPIPQFATPFVSLHRKENFKERESGRSCNLTKVNHGLSVHIRVHSVRFNKCDWFGHIVMAV